MNQFQCRKYIAEEVAAHITSLPNLNGRMENVIRMDENSTILAERLVGDSNLLNDEGSTAYQDWLTK